MSMISSRTAAMCCCWVQLVVYSRSVVRYLRIEYMCFKYFPPNSSSTSIHTFTFKRTKKGLAVCLALDKFTRRSQLYKYHITQQQHKYTNHFVRFVLYYISTSMFVRVCCRELRLFLVSTNLLLVLFFFLSRDTSAYVYEILRLIRVKEKNTNLFRQTFKQRKTKKKKRK